MHQETMKTPYGFTMPLAAYAAWIAVAITLGSAIGMYRLGLPSWSWIIEFAILFPVSYGILRDNTREDEDSHLVVINRTKLIVFAVISAALLGVGLIVFLG